MPSRYRVAATLLILLLLIPAGMALTIKNRSYENIEKEDPRDQIISKIGNEFSGTSVNNFQPILTLSRWGEVNVSILPSNFWPGSGAVTLTVNRSASKVTARRGNITINFYNISQGEGGFEYEIVWSQKPINNVLTFIINMAGLMPYYQPAMNATNKTCMNESFCGYGGDLGGYRPPEVVQSYVMYRSDGNSGDYSALGGKNLGTGQAAILYRPKITDNTGKWIWADQNINGSVLTITINQSWLDSASYPVILDPDFGFTSVGGSQDYQVPSESVQVGCNYTAPSSGTIDYITAYYSQQNTVSTKNSIWKVSDGSLIANGSANTTTVYSTFQWTNSYFSVPPSVTAGTFYYLGWVQSAAAYIFYKYNTGNTSQGEYMGVNNYTAPIALSSTTPLNEKISIYAVYTTGGAGITPSASFVCTSAGVRNSSRTCTNSSASLIPDTTDWYGIGPNPCFSGNLTNVLNPIIYPRTWGWCGLALIASNGGALTNTSNNLKATWTMPPWLGG